MKLQIFAIYDSATRMYGTPMFMASQPQAVRAIGDEINRPQEDNQLYKHPEDFTLFCLGEWDNNTCEFTSNTPPTLVVRAQDLVKS